MLLGPQQNIRSSLHVRDHAPGGGDIHAVKCWGGLSDTSPSGYGPFSGIDCKMKTVAAGCVRWTCKGPTSPCPFRCPDHFWKDPWETRGEEQGDCTSPEYSALGFTYSEIK